MNSYYTCCEDGMLSQVPPSDNSGLCPACRPATPPAPEPQQDDHAGSPARFSGDHPIAQAAAALAATPAAAPKPTADTAAAMVEAREIAQSSKAALSDDEIEDVWNSVRKLALSPRAGWLRFARAILARAGITDSAKGGA